jgi:hypothetical protein
MSAELPARATSPRPSLLPSNHHHRMGGHGSVAVGPRTSVRRPRHG